MVIQLHAICNCEENAHTFVVIYIIINVIPGEKSMWLCGALSAKFVEIEIHITSTFVCEDARTNIPQMQRTYMLYTILSIIIVCA